MSWLRNSPLRASFGKRRPSNSPPKDCDPTACYDSFKKHWQQMYEIIERTQVSTMCNFLYTIQRVTCLMFAWKWNVSFFIGSIMLVSTFFFYICKCFCSNVMKCGAVIVIYIVQTDTLIVNWVINPRMEILWLFNSSHV